MAVALILAHGIALAGAILTRLPLVLIVSAAALLCVSLTLTLRRSVFRLPLRELVLKADGLLEAIEPDGASNMAQVDRQTTVFPWLIALLLRIDGRKVALVLPPDALGREGHRQLRLWLRWKASAATV
jgi:hypothetical protein